MQPLPKKQGLMTGLITILLTGLMAGLMAVYLQIYFWIHFRKHTSTQFRKTATNYYIYRFVCKFQPIFTYSKVG